MSFFSKLIASTISFVPKPIVGYFARPYIAGDTLDDGVRVVKELNAKGIMATMDVLGEGVATREECIEMRKKCEEVLHAIDKHKLDSNLSVKPTQLGLSIDTEFCEQNIRALCEIARGYNNFVRIDMEDHPYTDSTLCVYRNLRKEFPGNVGTVIQAYLYRSANDIRNLMTNGQTNLRLCKGIYVEPASIAIQGKEEIRNNFNLLIQTLLENGSYVGIATHDDPLIDYGIDLVKKLNLDRKQYEFQMLLGVRPKKRDQIVAEGHRMRVYVPFGEQWYAYSTRRLKENPHMAMHIVKAIIGINK